MVARHRAAVWLLALALLAGQWLLVGHDARHWQPQDSRAHACQLCLHHAAQDLIAADVGDFVAAAVATVSDPALLPPAPPARRAPVYRSRAPPAVLA